MDLMIKPVSGQCNLDCAYCFYKKGHPCHAAMSPAQGAALVQKAAPYLRCGFPIVFQGGEPLLAGYEYFETVLSGIEACGATGPVCVQTNGTLLDDRFAALFKEHQVLVGVSLDGDQRTHELYRDDFAGVMRGIDCLRKRACAFNILSVVTDPLAERAEEIWAFYKREGFEFQQYIPCMPLAEAGKERLLDNAHYARFLKTLFDLWQKDLNAGRYVYVRLFENLMMLLSGLKAEDCGANGVCSPQFLIEADGCAYPCDFYVSNSYRLGSVNEDTFETLQKRLAQTGFVADSVALPEACAACRHIDLCRGGCKRYRAKDGTFVFCQAYRSFLDEAAPKMRAILKKAALK